MAREGQGNAGGRFSLAFPVPGLRAPGERRSGGWVLVPYGVNELALCQLGRATFDPFPEFVGCEVP